MTSAQAVRSEVYLSYEAADRLHITETQVRILVDLANGYTQQAIAGRLGYSEPGIQKQLNRLRSRFCAESNSQLVAKLAIQGVLL